MIHYLCEVRKIDKGIVHIYTTHSPFILSSLNNLLFAFSKGTEKDSINEKLSHSGVNAFTLFKEKDSWKIIYLIDTRRK